MKYINILYIFIFIFMYIYIYRKYPQEKLFLNWDNMCLELRQKFRIFHFGEDQQINILKSKYRIAIRKFCRIEL